MVRRCGAATLPESWRGRNRAGDCDNRTVRSLDFAPLRLLRPYVSKITIHEAGVDEVTPLEVLPRLHLVIGFQYGAPVRVARGGSEQALHPCGLTGLQTVTRRAGVAGSKFILAHLTPWGGPAFLRGSMADLLDRHLELQIALERTRLGEPRISSAKSARKWGSVTPGLDSNPVRYSKVGGRRQDETHLYPAQACGVRPRRALRRPI